MRCAWTGRATTATSGAAEHGSEARDPPGLDPVRTSSGPANGQRRTCHSDGSVGEISQGRQRTTRRTRASDPASTQMHGEVQAAADTSGLDDADARKRLGEHHNAAHRAAGLGAASRAAGAAARAHGEGAAADSSATPTFVSTGREEQPSQPRDHGREDVTGSESPAQGAEPRVEFTKPRRPQRPPRREEGVTREAPAGTGLPWSPGLPSRPPGGPAVRPSRPGRRSRPWSPTPGAGHGLADTCSPTSGAASAHDRESLGGREGGDASTVTAPAVTGGDGC